MTKQPNLKVTEKKKRKGGHKLEAGITLRMHLIPVITDLSY